jgi:proteasome lid subunit RPN8/RPN11
MERVVLPSHLIEQMLAQACASPHAEICGLVTARNGHPIRCIAVRNVAPQPQRLFSMDPQQQIDAMRSIREQGEELYGIYHSHPQGPAEPSATDIDEAAYPEALYLIVSLNDHRGPVLQAYRIDSGKARAVQLETDPAYGDSG